MKTFVFREDFGVGPKIQMSASFNLELNEEEITYIKDYIKRNGPDCGYAEMEYDTGSLFKSFDHRALFEKINDAANDAVVEAINHKRKRKLDFFDIPWETMSFDFIWAKELLEAK